MKKGREGEKTQEVICSERKTNRREEGEADPQFMV